MEEYANDGAYCVVLVHGVGFLLVFFLSLPSGTCGGVGSRTAGQLVPGASIK